VGLLGKPVGEVVRLTGIWREMEYGKDRVWTFFVTHVNGDALQSPLKFQSAFVSAGDNKWKDVPIRAGDTWDMVAYERLQVQSDEGINLALGRPLNQDPYGGMHACITGTVVKVTPGK
jgi:hypothetical protein